MIQETITSHIMALVKEHTGIEDALSPETNLEDDLAIDSLERVELAIKMEKAFGVALANSKLRHTLTIGDLIQLVIHAEQDKRVINV
ncbi:MAG: hypothetical protein E6J34_13375 [Chloroflexi bacterium]|nr:MAG: hypothetical protein E6J34_13375 [Chloroflexota bacterium]